MKLIWMFAPLLAFAGAANAQAPAAAEWYRAGHVTLNLTDAARDFSAEWQFDRADNGDNRVIREERRGGTTINATAMTICDDHALVLKGVAPERTQEMREIDEPVLHLQMLLRLLARAAPEGPQAMANDKLVEIREPAVVLRVRKGLEARRDFNAPWQARGRLLRASGGAVEFDLVFSHAGENMKDPPVELKLRGLWRQESRDRSFADATEIADWRVYRVDPVPVTVGGNTQLELTTAVRPLRYATLGHLRRHIEKSWSPNPKVAPIMQCKS